MRHWQERCPDKKNVTGFFRRTSATQTAINREIDDENSIPVFLQSYKSRNSQVMAIRIENRGFN
jgi:hypothetical protein